MKLTWIRWVLTVLLVLGCGWLVQGCGGGDDDPAPAAGNNGQTDEEQNGEAEEQNGEEAEEQEAQPTHVNVQGTWNGTRSSDAGSTTMQIVFTQNNDALQGGYQDTSGYAGNFTGNINGDDIEFTLVLTQGAPGEIWTFNGAANATGTQLEGTMHTPVGDNNISATK